MSHPLDVHPTAVVGPTARLGLGVTVGPFAVIEDDTDVGAGTEVRAHAVIKRFTRLGEGNAVHEGAILGGEPQDVGFTGAETCLRIGPGNRIREGVTIHRATRPGGETVIGSGCFLMAYTGARRVVAVDEADGVHRPTPSRFGAHQRRAAIVCGQRLVDAVQA